MFLNLIGEKFFKTIICAFDDFGQLRDKQMSYFPKLTVINRWLSRQRTPLVIFETFHLIHFKCTQQPTHQFPSYFSILKSIKNPTILLQFHAHIVTSGASRNVCLSNNLMSSYSSFGLIFNAQKFFEKFPHKNIFSWTIMVSGFTKNELFDEALNFFIKMVESGLLPNEVTISSILPAFASLGLKQMGKSVHCFWIRQGFGRNVVVETSLVDMYSRFGSMSIAHIVFDKMLMRNIVSWNVIISGYANNGMSNKAIELFNSMRRDGISVDYFTIMSLLSAALGANCGRTSTAIHAVIIRVGYNNEQRIQTALMDMYMNHNLIDEAYVVFDEIRVKDVVAWTLMLEGFSSGQYWMKAIEHFKEMMSLHYIALDSTAILSILSSCSSSGTLRQGGQIHALVLKLGFMNDVFLGSSLIDMYANCGDLDNARKYFDGMEKMDVACWNTMIRAMGMNGNGDGAIDLLLRMESLGVIPNESTLISILSSCSHACMVDEGLQIFRHMVEKWDIIPNLQHYACIVDLLGRSGRLDEARLVIDRMPLEPHLGVYGALLSACRVYGNTKMGDEIFQQLLKLGVIDVGHLCSVSNMFASVGDWKGTDMSNVVLKSKRMKKDPGYSVIEINHQVCVFMAGEKDHIKFAEFDRVLQTLLLNYKEANLPHTSVE